MQGRGHRRGVGRGEWCDRRRRQKARGEKINIFKLKIRFSALKWNYKLLSNIKGNPVRGEFVSYKFLFGG